MSVSPRDISLRSGFHPDAFDFLKIALRYTVHISTHVTTRGDIPQDDEPDRDSSDESQHVTGPELLEGIRCYALEQFGLLTVVVFDHWGIHCTEDFGRMVFDLIDRGEMFKTDRDQLSDFSNVYSFEQVFDRDYEIDTSPAFSH